MALHTSEYHGEGDASHAQERRELRCELRHDNCVRNTRRRWSIGRVCGCCGYGGFARKRVWVRSTVLYFDVSVGTACKPPGRERASTTGIAERWKQHGHGTCTACTSLIREQALETPSSICPRRSHHPLLGLFYTGCSISRSLSDGSWRATGVSGRVLRDIDSSLNPLIKLLASVEYAQCSRSASGSLLCQQCPPTSTRRHARRPHHPKASDRQAGNLYAERARRSG